MFVNDENTPKKSVIVMMSKAPLPAEMSAERPLAVPLMAFVLNLNTLPVLVKVLLRAAVKRLYVLNDSA